MPISLEIIHIFYFILRMLSAANRSQWWNNRGYSKCSDSDHKWPKPEGQTMYIAAAQMTSTKWLILSMAEME